MHDANSNVAQQVINNATTTFHYDRNRLLSNTDPNGTALYNYDPFGRVDTVTSAGQIIERLLYDGFDRTVEHRKQGATTQYQYDPLDRTVSTTENAGSGSAKTTTYAYLGLSTQVLTEESGSTVDKTYQYSPWGERLSQVKTTDSGTKEDSYYGYGPHTDVDQITDEQGNTRSTYGYTAYGSEDSKDATGVDKPDPGDPTKREYNAYRFNAKRWDAAAGVYDTGFRDYDPGLNRFLTRDSYNGALADMGLATDPWTMNRYAFAGGNPLSIVRWMATPGGATSPTRWAVRGTRRHSLLATTRLSSPILRSPPPESA